MTKKTVLSDERNISSHLASAIINGDYSVFDYYNEEHLIPKFEKWLQDIDEIAKTWVEDHNEAEGTNLVFEAVILDIEDEDSFFATCDFYNLASNCVTLKINVICCELVS